MEARLAGVGGHGGALWGGGWEMQETRGKRQDTRSQMNRERTRLESTGGRGGEGRWLAATPLR